MRAYASRPRTVQRIYAMVCDLVVDGTANGILIYPGIGPEKAPPGPRIFLDRWPLPNVWLGCSVEDQKRADERIPHLLNTPAAVRWISAEPLLGAIDLTCLTYGDGEIDALSAYRWEDEIANWRDTDPEWVEQFLDWYGLGAMPEPGPMHPVLDWVVAGGESGARARAMHPDWARQIRDDCKAADVPFHFKQWGQWLPWCQFNEADIEDHTEQTRFPTMERVNGAWRDVGYPMWFDSADGNIDDRNCVASVGKKRAGRLLDGRPHDGMPV